MSVRYISQWRHISLKTLINQLNFIGRDKYSKCDHIDSSELITLTYFLNVKVIPIRRITNGKYAIKAHDIQDGEFLLSTCPYIAQKKSIDQLRYLPSVFVRDAISMLSV